MKRVILLIIFGQYLYSCSHRIIPEITQEEMDNHVHILASDEMKGRSPGTLEDSVVQNYLVGEFRKAGLKKFDFGYLQEFEFLAGADPDENNELIYKGISYVQGEDFYPFSFSAEGEFTVEIAFCGYGFEISEGDVNRNDYKNIDPRGKWAMILRGEPDDNNVFLNRGSDRDKSMLAMEKGATGVILVSGPSFSSGDRLESSLTREPGIDIPVVQITRNFANILLAGSGYSVETLEKDLKGSTDKVFPIDNELSARLEINKVYSRTANVIGYVSGSNRNEESWMVVGAHYDHLGMGGKGSSSRSPDTIAPHNGADDNASGVAGVLELAEFFSSKRNRPEKNIIFVCFGAEEKGLLGSRYFLDHPPVDPEKMRVMVNLDMMGRMPEDSALQIGGVGTSAEGRTLVESVNERYSLNLALSEAGYGPSDHASFYAANIPVFFFSTGAHDDYHTPYDDADSINYAGLVTGTGFIAELIDELDDMESGPDFREAGPKRSTSRSFRDMVTLGIMPDVSGAETKGMKVLAVTKGKPADLGGMKKGDIIMEIEGHEVGNVYDYMYRLKQLKAGEQIVVSVKRNEEILDLLIQL